MWATFEFVKVAYQFVYTRYVHTCVLGMCANCWNHVEFVVELGYVDSIVELGDVDIIDELSHVEIACLILLHGHIEPILHYENYNMLVWMIDANMFDWEH